jgi:hypothetical protein
LCRRRDSWSVFNESFISLLRPKQQFRLRSQPEAAFLEDEESFGSLGGLDRFTPASSRSSVLESAAPKLEQPAVHSSEPLAGQTAESRSGLSANDHVASSADPDVTSPEEVEYEYVDEEEEVEEEEQQSADVVVSSSGINSKQFGSVPAGTTTAGTTTAGKGDSGDTGGRISQQEVNIFVIPSFCYCKLTYIIRHYRDGRCENTAVQAHCEDHDYSFEITELLHRSVFGK